jgi:DNA-binding NarL/FixJ family response regulator
MLRLLLADDHDVIRLGLRTLLERHAEWRVCGEASTGRQAVDLALQLKPDIAILDLSMPELNGTEATRQIVKALPGTRVLIYTMHETEKVVHDVLAAGARGIVLKTDVDEQLVSAVEALSRNKPYFGVNISETVLKGFLENAGPDSAPVASVLTSREREVLLLLADGKSNKDIAVRLDISTRTAEAHRAEIMRKLNARSLADLVSYAIRNDWLQP